MLAKTVMDDLPATFPEGCLVPEIQGEWMAWQTITGQEKRTAEGILELNRIQEMQGIDSPVSYYLPMYRITRRYENRHTITTHRAAFPAYIFVCGEAGALADAWSAPWIRKYARGFKREKNQKRLIKDLFNLQQAIDAGAELDQYPDLVVGRKCQIIDGPFEGLEGTVIDRDGVVKFVLQVHMLGRAVSLEITDPDVLEPLN